MGPKPKVWKFDTPDGKKIALTAGEIYVARPKPLYAPEDRYFVCVFRFFRYEKRRPRSPGIFRGRERWMVECRGGQPEEVIVVETLASDNTRLVTNAVHGKARFFLAKMYTIERVGPSNLLLFADLNSILPGFEKALKEGK